MQLYNWYLGQIVARKNVFAVKGIVHSKWKCSDNVLTLWLSKMWVCFSSEQIWLNLALHHLLSEWVPSEWESKYCLLAVKMLCSQILMFVSAVWTLILTAPIHWASDVMLNFTRSVLTRNKLIYILDGLRASTFSANAHLWWNCTFKEFLISWLSLKMRLLSCHLWYFVALAVWTGLLMF